MDMEPIKKEIDNNKKKMLFLVLTIVMCLGISFAAIYFVYSYQDKRNNEIKSGLVTLAFTEGSENIVLRNTVPMVDAEGKQNDAYIFTVKNTSKIPINAKITLEILETANPIDLSAVRYAFYVNNKEVKVDNVANLDAEKTLYTKNDFQPGSEIQAKIVFWVDYYYEEPNQTFSAKIKAIGEQYDIFETATETIKNTLVPYSVSSQADFQGGLVAINTNGDLYDENEISQEIREYRYSGPSVNNYVKFNDELWRIIGVFKDENGVENLKIVRNEKLNGPFPENYKIGDTTYNVKNNDTFVYWNKNDKGTNNNDWATSGLQYWLNTEQDGTEGVPNKGYLSTIKKDNKNMIQDTKYYLGTLSYSKSLNKITDTPKNAYINERSVTACKENKGPVENTGSYLTFETTSNCRVWANNQATWIGKIILIYPSDYGFSATKDYWDIVLSSFNTANSASWLNSINKGSEWLLSSSASYPNYISRWNYPGGIGNYITDGSDGNNSVRPSLTLNSNVKIVSGTGEKNNPYELTLEN